MFANIPVPDEDKRGTCHADWVAHTERSFELFYFKSLFGAAEGDALIIKPWLIWPEASGLTKGKCRL